MEDYQVSIESNVDWDYGDLPDTCTTLATSNGPRHVMSPNLFLGACVDGETTGVPSAAGHRRRPASWPGSPIYGTCATPHDDEDGVTLVTPLIPGNQACVAVTANNAVAGVLQGWIDFDGNGVFDASEALAFAGGGAVPAGPVSTNYCFNVPSTATFFGGQAYMRFRLSSAGGLNWTGRPPTARSRTTGSPWPASATTSGKTITATASRAKPAASASTASASI